jgi:hypothetical protein
MPSENPNAPPTTLPEVCTHALSCGGRLSIVVPNGRRVVVSVENLNRYVAGTKVYAKRNEENNIRTTITVVLVLLFIDLVYGTPYLNLTLLSAVPLVPCLLSLLLYSTYVMLILMIRSSHCSPVKPAFA